MALQCPNIISPALEHPWLHPQRPKNNTITTMVQKLYLFFKKIGYRKKWTSRSCYNHAIQQSQTKRYCSMQKMSYSSSRLLKAYSTVFPILFGLLFTRMCWIVPQYWTAIPHLCVMQAATELPNNQNTRHDRVSGWYNSTICALLYSTAVDPEGQKYTARSHQSPIMTYPRQQKVVRSQTN